MGTQYSHTCVYDCPDILPMYNYLHALVRNKRFNLLCADEGVEDVTATRLGYSHNINLRSGMFYFELLALTQFRPTVCVSAKVTVLQTCCRKTSGLPIPVLSSHCLPFIAVDTHKFATVCHTPSSAGEEGDWYIDYTLGAPTPFNLNPFPFYE